MISSLTVCKKFKTKKKRTIIIPFTMIPIINNTVRSNHFGEWGKFLQLQIVKF